METPFYIQIIFGSSAYETFPIDILLYSIPYILYAKWRTLSTWLFHLIEIFTLFTSIFNA